MNGVKRLVGFVERISRYENDGQREGTYPGSCMRSSKVLS